MSFVDHTVESAPLASRPALEGARRKFGFLPAAMARLAESPSLVGAFGKALAAFEGSSLGHVEREVVTLTVAHDAGCHVCMAIHSSILSAGDSAGLVTGLIAGLRAQTPLGDVRLEALRLFTRAVLAQKGDVSDEELGDFLAAGFSREQALDVVLGVGAYTMSTFANRLTRAPLDAALAPFAWP